MKPWCRKDTYQNQSSLYWLDRGLVEKPCGTWLSTIIKESICFGNTVFLSVWHLMYRRNLNPLLEQYLVFYMFLALVIQFLPGKGMIAVSIPCVYHKSLLVYYEMFGVALLTAHWQYKFFETCFWILHVNNMMTINVFSRFFHNYT